MKFGRSYKVHRRYPYGRAAASRGIALRIGASKNRGKLASYYARGTRIALNRVGRFKNMPPKNKRYMKYRSYR